MLNIFDEWDIPENIKVVKSNDAFFNVNTIIDNSELSQKVLANIDKAKRVSDVSFYGRSKEFGALDKSCLSTGTKTLLNVIQYPNICFSMVEMGMNAIAMLPLIKEGNLYTDNKVLLLNLSFDNDNCNICYRGKVFTKFSEFICYYNEVNNDEE